MWVGRCEIEQADAHVYLGTEVGRLLQVPGRFYASKTYMVRPCRRIQLAFYVSVLNLNQIIFNQTVLKGCKRTLWVLLDL